MVIFCCSNDKNISIELKRTFLKTFEIKAPNDKEREKILSWILQSKDIKTNIDLNEISNKTHGFLFEDLKTLVHYAITDFYKTNNLEEKHVPKDYFFQALGESISQDNYLKIIAANFRFNAIKL